MKKILPASARLIASVPVVTVSPTVAQLLERVAKGENIRVDLVRLFATINVIAGRRVPPEFVQVPVELLAMAGEELVGRSRWTAFLREAATRNAKLAKEARARKEHWQRKADPVWERHPSYTKRAVARIIAPDQVDTVRRLIMKKK